MKQIFITKLLDDQKDESKKHLQQEHTVINYGHKTKLIFLIDQKYFLIFFMGTKLAYKTYGSEFHIQIKFDVTINLVGANFQISEIYPSKQLYQAEILASQIDSINLMQTQSTSV